MTDVTHWATEAVKDPAYRYAADRLLKTAEDLPDISEKKGE